MYKSENKDIESIVNGSTFRLRLSNGMKLWLFKESDRTGNTVSQIIRDAITEYMKK